MSRPKRRLMTVEVTLSVKPGVTAAQARRELRTRCNDLACWSADLEEGDVRVRKMKGVR
jgi:hypothetical protein